MGRVNGKAVREKYRALTLELIEKKLTVTTMESCTGGLIASLLTDTEGSSAILKGAFVTYSNVAKIMQGVPEDIILKYGVYSRQTAEAMAGACKQTYDADIAVGVTGSFSNPDPNNRDSIPGEVYYCISGTGSEQTRHLIIPAMQSRLDYKLYVADRIADDMREML